MCEGRPRGSGLCMWNYLPSRGAGGGASLPNISGLRSAKSAAMALARRRCSESGGRRRRWRQTWRDDRRRWRWLRRRWWQYWMSPDVGDEGGQGRWRRPAAEMYWQRQLVCRFSEHGRAAQLRRTLALDRVSVSALPLPDAVRDPQSRRQQRQASRRRGGRDACWCESHLKPSTVARLGVKRSNL